MTTADLGYPPDDQLRFRPHERVSFEYRIDRQPRLLRRDHMFPNTLHPRGLAVDEDFFVCNSLHSHNLRAGLASLAPGTSHDFPGYPNEHQLLHLTGGAEYRLAGESLRLGRGDQLFVPVGLPYTVANVGAERVWLFSGYARVDDWGAAPGPVDPGRSQYALRRATPLDAVENGSDDRSEVEGLAGTHVGSRILDVAAGADVPPRHLQVEQIVVCVEGRSVWHVAGVDHALGVEDLLFVPALSPFSVRAQERSRFVVYDVALV